MGAIRKIEYSTAYDWGVGGVTVWNLIADFLAEGLETGLEDIITVEMGDNADKQDGVKLAGEFRATGATLPTQGTRTWFRFTKQDATAIVVGGERGCRVGLGAASVRPLGGGPAYTRVTYTATGSDGGDLVEDDLSS